MSGTSGFTITALIGISRAAPENYGYFATHPSAAEVLRIVATWVGVFMWVFTFWVFGLAFWINVVELFVKREGRWTVNVTFTNVAWGEFIRRCERGVYCADHDCSYDIPECGVGVEYDLSGTGVGKRGDHLGFCGDGRFACSVLVA